MPLKVASDITSRKHPRPRSVINPTGKISFVGGVFLFLNYRLLDIEKSLLEKRLVAVDKRQNEIKDELLQFALSLAKDFLTNI